MLKNLVKVVNLELGMPTAPQARARLKSEIHAARQGSFRLLKIIHGYGSSGVGGDLRLALQAALVQMTSVGEIRGCIFGENWRKADDRSWQLVKQWPDLKSDRDFGRGNRGITIVLL